MYTIFYSIIISVVFAVVAFWYAATFLQDIDLYLHSKGLDKTQILPFVISGIIVACAFNGLSIYFGWEVYFLVMTTILGVLQLLAYENISKLVLLVLIAGQIPAAFIAIRNDVQAGCWNWLYWIFSVVLFPAIEVALYWLFAFISKEIDNLRSRRS